MHDWDNQWSKAPDKSEFYLDVPNVGRYLVRRSRPGATQWVVALNGSPFNEVYFSVADAMDRAESHLSVLRKT